jgi:hypothetical protein
VIRFDYAFLTLALRPQTATPADHQTDAIRSQHRPSTDFKKPATKFHLY